MKADVVVIGGGATGLFTALELSARGVSVAVVERGMLLSGTSGRYHGLLHSGARYATADRAAAIECREENANLAKMAPFAIINEGGLFVRLKGDDDSYTDRFLESLKGAEIDYDEVALDEVRRLEPELSPDVDFAVGVQDRVLDPFKLFYSVALAAKDKGAKFLVNVNVTDLDGENHKVKTTWGSIGARVVVNAAGPWVGKILHMYGKNVNMMPAIGVMLVYDGRKVNRAINRLRPPSDGDIVLPFYQKTILGTTAQLVEDVDQAEISPDDVQSLVDEGSKMIPALGREKFSRMYYSARPLMSGGDARTASRDFEIIDDDWVVSVVGGKLTTSRLIAEEVSDMVCSKLGVNVKSMTKNMVLSPPSYITQVSGTIGEDIYGPGVWLSNMMDEISN